MISLDDAIRYILIGKVTCCSLAAGVFGVPTAVVDNRCFWGFDATEMLLAYLRGDPFFQSAQLKRAENLPPGVQRKQAEMKLEFYKPEKTVCGPAYSNWFKLLATVISSALAAYAVSIAERFPLMQYSFGVKVVLFCSAVMLVVSYYWFLRSTVTIDDKGITQTWLYNRQVEWRDVRSAKMIGIPFVSWLFPPRLVVRTGNSFTTFNGGSRAVLVEFAKISLAYQMKK